MKPPCDDFKRSIEAHFSLRTQPAQEVELRQHLLGCPACRECYDRFALFSRLDPRAPKAFDRIGSALGLRTSPPWFSGRVALLLPAAAAVGAALLLVMVRPSTTGQGQFLARGSGDPKASLLVYRVRPGALPARVEDHIGPADQLAFAYVNPTRHTRLLIFGVDEHRHVYWYHPEWRVGHSPPPAISVATDGKLHELAEAIGQPFDGKRMSVYGLFIDDPMSTAELEARLASDGAATLKDGISVPLRIDSR